MYSVAVPGPPVVRTKTWSKTCTARIRDSTRTTTIVGISSGRVMSRKLRQAPAPSIDAASYSSLGIDCSPASRMSIWKPICAHTLTTITHSRAQLGSTRKGRRSRPIPTRMPLKTPSGCRIHFQIRATTTGESSTG